MKIKIALAEDNDRLAASIEANLLLFREDIEFVHRASNGRELLEYLSTSPAVDVILMDIEMPEMDGITACGNARKNYPHIKIIMLTVFDDEERIFQSILAGASGYLLKDETPVKLFEGIKMIMEGGAPMSPSIAFKTLSLLRNPDKIFDNTPDEKVTLSERETEVLEQLSQGLDYVKIARNLFLSPSTVRKHIENIYKKLQVHSKVEAVQKAVRHRLI